MRSLHFEWVRPVHDGADTTIVFLHGILGSGRNWVSFARRCVTAHPHLRAAVVDLRHHGQSHGQDGPDTLLACAEDISTLRLALDDEPAFVVGHSFGGKVAAAYAQHFAADLRHLFVLDSPPGKAPVATGSSEIGRVLEAVQAVRTPLPDRQALVDDLTGRGISRAIARWMTTNLTEGDGGLVFRFSLPRILEMLQSYADYDAWPVFDEPPTGSSVTMVRGGRSDRFSADDIAHLDRLAAAGTIAHHVMPEAGHWLHTDDPDGLFALVSPALAA